MKKILFASATSVFAIAFMSEVVETVLIKGKGGDPVRVNKSDYDADQSGDKPSMTLHTDDKEDQPEPVVGGVIVPVAPGLTIPPAPSAPGPNPVAPQTANVDTLMVTSNGKTGKALRFFVVKADGSRVEDMLDVDKDGYENEALAWAAIMAVKKQPFEQTATAPAGMPPAPVLPTS